MTNKIKDESRDNRYFTITPRLVWALSRTPYDYTLWCVVKMIAGDTEECFLGTEDLQLLSMMGRATVHDSRAYLLEVGLLEGEVRKDRGYPKAVWHLRIPDIWGRSIKWAEEHIKLSDRIEFKDAQKKMLKDEREAAREEKIVRPTNAEDRSPGEFIRSPGEFIRSPGIRKEEPKKNHKENPIPQPQPAAGLDDGDISYDYDDPDGEASEKAEQGWMVPELPIHNQVLAVAHAKRFKAYKLKSRLTGLSQAIAAGNVLGDGVYQACLDGLNGKEKLVEPLPPIPASWLDWRLEHAKQHRWSVDGTVSALFDRDVLAKHCNYHLNRLGIPVQVEYESEELGPNVEVVQL